MKMKSAVAIALAGAFLSGAHGWAADAANQDGAPKTVAAAPDKKPDAKTDAKPPKTLAEADPETRKRLSAMLEEAKKTAREKMNTGVERALANHPKISNEMAQLLRSSSTHETWLKLVVDGALKANSILPLEQQYQCSCMAISRMRDVTTGLEGDAFIEEYITTSIAQTQGTEKSPGDKDAGATDKNDKNTRKKRSHVVQDTNGMIQAGGN